MSKVESIFPDPVISLSLYVGLPVRNYKAALTWYDLDPPQSLSDFGFYGGDCNINALMPCNYVPESHS